MTKAEVLRSRVRKGAAYLDKTKPGWEKEIEIPKLSLDSTYACILGQTYGDFGGALEQLSLSLEKSFTLGFCLTDAEENIVTNWCKRQQTKTGTQPSRGSHPYWETLTKLWITEICVRRYGALVL